MGRRELAVCNVLGGVTWATTVAALGYGAGAAYASVLRRVDHASEIVLAAVVVLVVAWVLVRRVLRRRGAEL